MLGLDRVWVRPVTGLTPSCCLDKGGGAGLGGIIKA